MTQGKEVSKATDGEETQRTVDADLDSTSQHDALPHYVAPYSAPLHRKLKSQHIQMIAIEGIIGPGLFVGSGNALHLAGPGAILVSFSLIGIIVFFVMQSLGEVAIFYL